MKTKLIVILLGILSSLTTLSWALGLILANINLFLISMILLAISIIPTIKYYKNISEFFKSKNGEVVADERKEHIEGKAALPAFAIMLVISIYSGIAIFTLRNTYPQYSLLIYPFFIIATIGFTTYTISNAYYKRKYGS
ncbi:MAG: DUF2178 domain-containing protein [Methanobrevibacter sp.]|nr:DUF2178 domain-containing protein [Methanobrevibacter sp.]